MSQHIKRYVVVYAEIREFDVQRIVFARNVRPQVLARFGSTPTFHYILIRISNKGYSISIFETYSINQTK